MFLGMCRECSMFLHQAVVLVIPSKSNTMLAPDLPVDENEDLFSDIMKDIVMSEQFYNEMMGERVEPDKFGCYSIFCHSFLRSTDYMYDDFPYIAHNFLSNCSIEELKEYTNRSFIEQLKERDIMYSKEYKPWQRAKKIVQYACDSVGCNTDYVDKCGGSYYDESTDLAEMHAILKLLFPKEEISFEEKQTLTVLYGSVKALLLSIMQSADLVDELLGFENYYENSMEERLFNESMFPEKKQQGNNVVVEHKSIVKENTKEQRYAEQDLLDEIKQLREKIHSMEQKNAKVQHNILIKQKTSKEYDVLKEEYDAQKEELVALREFVYKMTDKEDIELPANDMVLKKYTEAILRQHEKNGKFMI